MPRKLLNVSQFRTAMRDRYPEAKIGEGGEDSQVMVVRAQTAEPVAGEGRKIKFIFSDGSVDRMGDIIDPEGWELANFRANPIALFGHDSRNVESVIGRASDVGVQGKSLVGDIDFAEASVNPRAEMTYQMVKAGLLNAVSVGFQPLEFAWSSDKDRPWGIDFLKQELVEISVVPVPANANALVLARDAGIDTGPLAEWAQKILDGEGRVSLARSFVEELFRAAKTPRVVRQRYLDPQAEPTPDWHVGAAADLPIAEEDGHGWDAAGASSRLFAAAGFDGENPDGAQAARGFLLHDAANPTLKASYRLPFADIVDGELKTVALGLRSATSKLTTEDVPVAARERAAIVIASYEARLNSLALERLKSGAKISAESGECITGAMGHMMAAHEMLNGLMTAPDDGDGDEGGSPPEVLDPVKADIERRMREAEARIRAGRARIA